MEAQSGPRARRLRGARSWGWLAVSAAGALVLLVVLRLPPRGSSVGTDAYGLQALIAAVAQDDARPVTGRLGGPFAYAPARTQQRGTAIRPSTTASPAIKIAAARIELLATPHDSAEAHAALGVAALVTGNLDQAITSLERARERGHAAAHVDLSAAYLERARLRDRAEDWPRALAAAERALRLDARNEAAQFNRALALEGLHLNELAGQAWEHYRAGSPVSSAASSGSTGSAAPVASAASAASTANAWQREAAEHAASLDRLRNTPTVDASTDHQRWRERIEDDLLMRWGEATLAKDASSTRWLAEATHEARALADAGGDTMPLDATLAIDRALATRDRVRARNASAVIALARGHVAYGRARQLFLRDRLAEASATMTEASAAFARVRSPYARWAPVFDAIATRMAGSPVDAQRRLAAASDRDLPRTYFNLRARIAWTAGVIDANLARYDLGREHHRRAIAIYSEAGETENLCANHIYIAEAEWYLGERREAWTHEIAALALIDRLSVTARRNVVLFMGAHFALNDHLSEAALSFQSTLIASIDRAGFTSGRTSAYMQRARTLAELGDTTAALADLDRAEAARVDIQDPGVRARSGAEVRAIRAEVQQRSAPRAALRDAESAIDYFGAGRFGGHLVKLFLLEAQIFEASGDMARAGQRLRDARAAFEQDRAGLTSLSAQMQAFQDERRAFREMLRFEALVRRDLKRALQVTEDMRSGSNVILPVAAMATAAGTAVAPPPLERVDPLVAFSRIRPDVAAVYYAVLDDRVLGWVVTNTGVADFQVSLPSTELHGTVRRLRKRIDDGESFAQVATASASLSDRLLAPVLQRLGDRRIIAFIPDGPLVDLPFAVMPVPPANGRLLIEDFTVLVAPSLSAFLSSSARLSSFAPDSVLAVGDGHDPGVSDLPRLAIADSEAAEIGGLYPRATVLRGLDATRARLFAADRAVLHFSGHTLANPEQPLYARLLLAPDPARDDDGMLAGIDIASHPFTKTFVAILGSCDGAVGRMVDGEGVLSVAEMFRAGGVATVVASLWPINDQAHDFLITLHRELRTRHDPVAAVRASQLRLLREHGFNTPVRLWGGFIAFGGIGPASIHQR